MPFVNGERQLPLTTSEPKRGGSQGRAAVFLRRVQRSPLTAATAEAIRALVVLIGSNRGRECSRALTRAGPW